MNLKVKSKNQKAYNNLLNNQTYKTCNLKVK